MGNKKQDIHVVPHADGWATKRSGADHASSIHPTQQDAIDAGRASAKRDAVELVIHGRDGKIRDKDSYGNDPFPPRDTKR